MPTIVGNNMINVFEPLFNWANPLEITDHFFSGSSTGMYAFCRWEEIGVTGENPQKHEENIQPPHRKISGSTWSLNLGHACWEETELTPKPSCYPR